MTDYVLRRGEEGAQRLRLLARVTWPTTRRLFRHAGLTRGMHCLDLGCGIGEVTWRLARWVGAQGQAVGIDVSETFVELARQRPTGAGPRPLFRAGSALELAEDSAYDLVYARFLLSHLPQPERVLERMKRAVRPGGVIVVEDVDFTGHFAQPPCAALDRYVDLYQTVVRHNGGDGAIGPRLPGLLRDAGLAPIQLKVVQPTFGARRLALVTLEHIREKVLAAGLATPAEFEAIRADLERFGRAPGSLMSLPRLFQVWGRRPWKEQ